MDKINAEWKWNNLSNFLSILEIYHHCMLKVYSEFQNNRSKIPQSIYPNNDINVVDVFRVLAYDCSICLFCAPYVLHSQINHVILS